MPDLLGMGSGMPDLLESANIKKQMKTDFPRGTDTEGGLSPTVEAERNPDLDAFDVEDDGFADMDGISGLEPNGIADEVDEVAEYLKDLVRAKNVAKGKIIKVSDRIKEMISSLESSLLRNADPECRMWITKMADAECASILGAILGKSTFFG